MDIQIVIPMTGNGTRFQEAGYTRLKPFIKVHKKPIINWVVKMFPGDQDKVIYICRDDHIRKYSYYMKSLREITRYPKIHRINNWEKKGPANDILLAADSINDEKPVLVSYCDFFMVWDYKKFKKIISSVNPDGIVPCYTGFHPHLIHKENLYATCDVDEKFFLKNIREKYQINKDKMKDFHSPGLYYFKSGKLLKKYCEKLISSNQSINGEFYMSLPFNFMVEDGLKVYCPPLAEHFCQWGTPKDLEEYKQWMSLLEKIEK